MAEVNVSTRGRFNGRDVAVVAGAAGILVGVMLLGLIAASGLFDDTTTTTTAGAATASAADDVTLEVRGNELTTAQFASAGLMIVGALTLVGGLGVALTEVVVEEGSATTPDEAEVEVTVRGLTATGIGAVLVGAGEAAKALASALRGMKASGMLVLMGGLMLIMSGAVAWQTIPGTDRSPTIEIPATTTPTVPTTTTVVTTTTTLR